MPENESDTPDVTVSFDAAYRVMLDELEDDFGDLDAEFERVVKERLRQLYDNREELREQAAEQGAGFGDQ